MPRIDTMPRVDTMRAVETPCIKVCRLDPVSRLCLGCGRTGAEIGGWLSFTDAERRQVIADLPRRLEHLRGRQADSECR